MIGLRRSQRPVTAGLVVLALAALSGLLAGLLGCAGATSRSTGHLVRSPGLHAVRTSGMAIAPFGQKNANADAHAAAELLALISDEFYRSLEVSLPRAPLVPPDEVAALVAAQGERAQERLRWVRRVLMRGEMPDAEALVALSRIVQHRYLLLSWVDEEQRVGSEDDAQIYFDMGMRDAVRVSTFVRVRGRIEGVVLDLWEHELLWRGAEAYRSPKVYGKLDEIQRELERIRVGAAHRFANLCGEF